MSIHFDPTNLSAAMVGEKHGLTPQEVAAAKPAALAALAGFQKSVEKGAYGFPHLPFQAKLIREITAYATRLETVAREARQDIEIRAALAELLGRCRRMRAGTP